MADWQDLVLALLTAPTDDLRELARIAGRDPRTFYRDANFRKADLSGQDLDGITLDKANLKSARMPQMRDHTLETANKLELMAEALSPHLTPRQQSDLALARGDDLLARGKNMVSSAWLELAVRAYERALEIAPKRGDPLYRALLRDRLGVALTELGLRRPEPQTLEAAIIALNAALGARRKEVVPSEWAESKVHLASAMAGLGMRKVANSLLHKAEAAAAAAVRAQANTGDPEAAFQARLSYARARLALWLRRSDPADLIIATEEFRSSSLRMDRRLSQHLTASGQNMLGCALVELISLFGPRAGRLSNAVTAIEKALKILTAKDFPLEWASANHNHGRVLFMLHQREGDNAALEESAKAFERALTIRTRDDLPLQWAESLCGLATTLRLIGLSSTRPEVLVQAIDTLEEALKELTVHRSPLDWAAAVVRLAEVEFDLARLLSQRDLAERGNERLRLALDRYIAWGRLADSKRVRTLSLQAEVLLRRLA